MSLPSSIKAVAFDLDGTIYFGDQLADGVKELLQLLHKKHIHIFYFTNNSSKSRQQIYEKLNAFDLSPELSKVYSSSYASTVYAALKGFKRIFCLGSDDLTSEFLDNNIEVSNSNVDAIFIGLDHLFDYRKLTEILHLAQDCNGPIIACNIDKNYPVENNKLMPGCGSIVAAVEACLERKIDFIVGKPNRFMMDLLARDWNLKQDEIMIVGDSYSSDIKMAENFGCKSILISKNKNPKVMTMESIAELIPLISSPCSMAVVPS